MSSTCGGCMLCMDGMSACKALWSTCQADIHCDAYYQCVSQLPAGQRVHAVRVRPPGLQRLPGHGPELPEPEGLRLRGVQGSVSRPLPVRARRPRRYSSVASPISSSARHSRYRTSKSIGTWITSGERLL